MKNRDMIKSLIYELLNEADDDSGPVDQKVTSIEDEEEISRPSLESADSAIDSFLVKFEEEAIVDPEDEDDFNLSESLVRGSLYALLREQEEEVEVEEDLGEDEEVEVETETTAEPEPTGNEQIEEEEAAELPKPNLNIDEFAKRVARLASNSDTLLRITDIVINRARKYLEDNYGDKHADELLTVLEDEYGFEFEDEQYIAAPYAIGANPAGAGISGGG